MTVVIFHQLFIFQSNCKIKCLVLVLLYNNMKNLKLSVHIKVHCFGINNLKIITSICRCAIGDYRKEDIKEITKEKRC